VYLKSVNIQSRFFLLLLLLLLPLLFVACTEDVKIHKSALRYFNEGNAALKHRDYQVAIWNYQKAISLDSESPNFHYNLGLTYYEIGNYSESIDSFKHVELLVPSQTDTYYNLALAHYKMSNSRLADIYFNRYQDMLSLRKAQQRLVEVRKEQERDAKINATEAKPKILKKSSTLTKKNPTLKTKSDSGKLTIPGWE
jgi:tetratricopeptide (TPR) repeat protein